VQIATHEHHYGDDNHAEDEPGACHDIHGKLQRSTQRPPVLDGARPILDRVERPYVGAIKDA
jgi:hypothetical protein